MLRHISWSYSIIFHGLLSGKGKRDGVLRQYPPLGGSEAIGARFALFSCLTMRKHHQTAANGSLTVDDEDDGDVTVVLKAAETVNLVPGTYSYDLQMVDSNGPTTKSEGTFAITADVTRAIT